MTGAPAPFVHLDVLSAYSFRRGASLPETLVEAAVAQGFETLALTDWAGPYGAPRFCQAARTAGLRPIIGATVTVQPGGRLLLLVRDLVGWRSLCRLLTAAHLAGSKEQPRLDLAILAQHTAGLTALVGPDSLVATRLLAGDSAAATLALDQWRALFPSTGGGAGSRLWLELVDHLTASDRRRNRLLAQLGQTSGIGLAATNQAHLASPGEAPIHDVLTVTREHTTLAEAGLRLTSNHEAWLKPAAAMATLFDWCPAAIEATRRIADTCTFTLDALDTRLPTFPLPPGETSFSYLHQLATAGARERYRPLSPAAASQLAHELTVIERLGLADYFLLVWDIARECRVRGILCQGRGSAANSVVAYCLGITNVDPVGLGLLFERFLSEERGEMPDIDLDLANDRREEIIQYVYARYGRDRAAMVCEVICYRHAAALRDAGRALGLPPARLNDLARLAKLGAFPPEDEPSPAPAAPANPASAPPPGDDWLARPLDQQLGQLVHLLTGLPRHLGIHVGGMVITAQPLIEVIPIERARMDGRTVVIWDKDDIGLLGMAKIDLLGLGMLQLLGRCLQLIQTTRGVRLDLSRLLPDDPSVYALMSAADTVGIFQVESRAQMTLAPRFQAQTFYDLMIQVALIRPGPIQGGSVHPYLRRRQGVEPVTYLHPSLEPILRRTLGVPLFQEQGMRVAMAVAGFSPGEADALRRAMGSKRSASAMQALEERFMAGTAERGIDPATAATIWRQLAAFASYGFPESHAASFALLVYQSAYLKRYYPAEYLCALLASQPMGFWPVSTIVGDARRHQIMVLPPDVQLSGSEWQLEVQPAGQLALRTGLQTVKGVGPEQAARLTAARAAGPYLSLADFRWRTGLDGPVLENLAACGALASLEPNRRLALWAVTAAAPPPNSLPGALPDEPAPFLPPMTVGELIMQELRVLGFSPTGHLLALLRPQLTQRGLACLIDLPTLPEGARVRTAAQIVLIQRPPTAHGMAFLALEDETGLGQAVLRPDIARRCRAVLLDHALVIIEGTLQRAEGTVNILASAVTPLLVPISAPALTSQPQAST